MRLSRRHGSEIEDRAVWRGRWPNVRPEKAPRGKCLMLSTQPPLPSSSSRAIPRLRQPGWRRSGESSRRAAELSESQWIRRTELALDIEAHRADPLRRTTVENRSIPNTAGRFVPLCIGSDATTGHTPLHGGRITLAINASARLVGCSCTREHASAAVCAPSGWSVFMVSAVRSAKVRRAPARYESARPAADLAGPARRSERPGPSLERQLPPDLRDHRRWFCSTTWGPASPSSTTGSATPYTSTAPRSGPSSTV
ncbi:hypothetical protein EV642_12898 [Kribbella sp. VKM Ac-2500]|nr:hypothetical protein EV642_12898 [Kribbella sp. VKM Ac-2500]